MRPRQSASPVQHPARAGVPARVGAGGTKPRPPPSLTRRFRSGIPSDPRCGPQAVSGRLAPVEFLGPTRVDPRAAPSAGQLPQQLARGAGSGLHVRLNGGSWREHECRPAAAKLRPLVRSDALDDGCGACFRSFRSAASASSTVFVWPQAAFVGQPLACRVRLPEQATSDNVVIAKYGFAAIITRPCIATLAKTRRRPK